MFLLKPCVIPSCLCQIFCSTESWLFSITECFDFCFSLPISLNFIIPWYIFRFPQWRSNKPWGSQCFSYPGMTVTLSTPPVSQRKEQKETGSRKSHYILGVFLIESMNSLNISSSHCGDHIYQMWYYNSTIVVFYIYFFFYYWNIQSHKGIKSSL